MRKRRNKERDGTRFWCRHCGSPYITGLWTAQAYGTCCLEDVETHIITTDEGEEQEMVSPNHHGNWDTSGEDDYNIDSYECSDCGEEARAHELVKLVTCEVNDVQHLKNFREP